VLASAVFALPFAIPRAREKARYNQHMTSLPPIDPDLVTTYLARVVALAADFVVAIVAAGPRWPQEVALH
jgi:hypothetical protein